MIALALTGGLLVIMALQSDVAAARFCPAMTEERLGGDQAGVNISCAGVEPLLSAASY